MIRAFAQDAESIVTTSLIEAAETPPGHSSMLCSSSADSRSFMTALTSPTVGTLSKVTGRPSCAGVDRDFPGHTQELGRPIVRLMARRVLIRSKENEVCFTLITSHSRYPLQERISR
jgi:hypothetical protein